MTAYATDVRTGRFPSDEESYHLSNEVARRLLAEDELVVGLYGSRR
jgi:hypothetical protein